MQRSSLSCHVYTQRLAIFFAHTSDLYLSYPTQRPKRVQHGLRLCVDTLVLNTMHSPARESHSANSPVNQMYLQVVQLWYGSQQINKLPHPRPNTSGQPSTPTVVFDHPCIIVDKLDIHYVVLDA